jgi:hypothetical protein
MIQVSIAPFGDWHIESISDHGIIDLGIGRSQEWGNDLARIRTNDPINVSMDRG